MGLKELAYRATTTRPGRHLLERLAPRVRLPFDRPPATGPQSIASTKDRSAVPQSIASTRDRRTRVVVTVDTEGGYVAADEERVWQGREPQAFEGYVYGIRNTLAVLDRHGVHGTFFVAPHGLAARGAARAAVEASIRAISEGGHELGLHLHPASDRAIAERLGTTFADGSARYLAIDDVRRLVNAGRDLLAELLGGEASPLEAFRWGNWGLDDRAARVVAEAGFRIDSSAVPGLRDRKSGDRPRFDWSARRSIEPWEIAPGLTEIPIATFRWLGRLRRADPLYGPLVGAALERYRASGARVFVVMTHSTEATHRDGAPTRALADLDAFLALARGLPDVDVMTLGHARDTLLPSLAR